jgi:tetratricopeptide (TPR) repeat protein
VINLGQLPAKSAQPAAERNSPPETAVQSTQSEAAKDLAAKIVTAYGGAARLKELKNLAYKSHGTHSVVSGVSGASNSLVCSIVGQGDKIRLETRLIGQEMILGFNGKDSWTQFGDWVNPSTETTVKRLSDEIRHGLNLLADISDPQRRLELTGKKAVQGKTCYVLMVYADDGKPSTFYCDQATHLVLRSEFIGVDHEQGVPALQAVEYFDYRPIAGTVTPYKTVEYTGQKKTSETVLDAIEIGLTVDDKLFEMPAESEVARVKEGPVTVPFDFIANEIIVKVKIGSSDYKLILDTGASQSVIDKSVASTIGSVSQADFSITAGSKAVPLSYLTVPSLTIGDITLNSVPALVTDLSSFAKAIGERPAGLLGANILRRFLITIDFRDKKLVFADPHKVSIPEGATVIKTSPVYGATALVIPGKLDDKLSLNFLVDTGASFSNLPQTAVKPINSVPLLPVGQIFGIDGKKQDIGSIRLSTLKLGALQLKDPVFALSPEGASTTGGSGLFTAGSMGILGTPIWSQFRMTIDYRNERLILEPIATRTKNLATNAKLRAIERAFHRGRNIDLAIKACEEIVSDAHPKYEYGTEALGLAALAGYYMDKSTLTKNPLWLSLAGREYARASSLARQANDKEISGNVMAQWAGYYLSNAKSPSDLLSARSLLQQAAATAPTDATVFVWLGAMLLKANNLEMAEKTLDQALMLDPSNWRALWSQYELSKAQNNSRMQYLVINQLKHYYGDSPEVLAIAGQKSAPAVKKAAASVKPK